MQNAACPQAFSYAIEIKDRTPRPHAFPLPSEQRPKAIAVPFQDHSFIEREDAFGINNGRQHRHLLRPKDVKSTSSVTESSRQLMGEALGVWSKGQGCKHEGNSKFCVLMTNSLTGTLARMQGKE